MVTEVLVTRLAIVKTEMASRKICFLLLASQRRTLILVHKAWQGQPMVNSVAVCKLWEFQAPQPPAN